MLEGPWFENLTAEQLRGAKLITEPISVVALGREVAKLKKPEEGFCPELIIHYSPYDKQWYLLHLNVEEGVGKQRRILLYAIPARDRMTLLITKRHAQKGYKSLDTLVRQMTDMFGKATRFAILIEHYPDEHYYPAEHEEVEP